MNDFLVHFGAFALGWSTYWLLIRPAVLRWVRRRRGDG